MHESVKGSLEEYLRGGAGPETEQHLRSCEECRNEVEAMRAQSRLFQSLKAPANLELDAGFYARVMNRVETQTRPSVWSLFGESLFAKRLVYASATFLVLLGSFLASAPPVDEDLMAGTPEVILAGQQLPQPVSMDDPQKDRDVILVNLASWGGDGESEAQDYQ
jgi:anti-sigma factor RsiW